MTTQSDREDIATRANEASQGSRRGGAPRLAATSSRAALIQWLVWNDPNGSYTDKDSEVDGHDPLTIDEAWELIDDTLQESRVSESSSSKMPSIASKKTGDYRVELIDHNDSYSLNITFTGKWAGGAPVEIWLNDETGQSLDADPEDVVEWFNATVRGDRSVMELLNEARYDEYGNKQGRGGGTVAVELD
jgi:hypothetical protein